MDARLIGYKIIAILAVGGAVYSCSQQANSGSDPVVLAQLQSIEAQLDELMAQVGAVQLAVSPTATSDRPCTIDEVINSQYESCNSNILPEDISVSTTYCIEQGRSGSVGASFAVAPEVEVELGGGWPNVIWGKMTGTVAIPPVFAIPGPVPVPVVLPSEVEAGGEMSLGRALSICVDIPVKALDASGIEQVHDLVRGVNVEEGKYARRTGRVLNFAARRTPIANADSARDIIFDNIPFEGAEDSFDRAEAAVERLISGDFSPTSMSGTEIFGGGVFQELGSTLDLPRPVLETISDPHRIFSAMQVIGQGNIANACDSYGITPAMRSRFPALANQCARFGIYPAVDLVLDFPGRIRSMFTASGLRTFICDNVSLSVLFNECG